MSGETTSTRCILHFFLYLPWQNYLWWHQYLEACVCAWICINIANPVNLSFVMDDLNQVFNLQRAVIVLSQEHVVARTAKIFKMTMLVRTLYQQVEYYSFIDFGWNCTLRLRIWLPLWLLLWLPQTPNIRKEKKRNDIID